ncbi:MAG TPA: response regulator [Geobacteraceae bacterium]|nr:response regulator [Geobacteraceae bacterium]
MEAKRFKVLAVDDEPVNLMLLEKILRDSHDIILASSGVEAIAKVKEHEPDLILLDVMMPEMSGFDVCRQLKADERYREIPVIFITALSGGDNESKGLQLGAMDYIVKPFIINHIRLRVRNQLELKYRTEQLLEQRAELEARTLELEVALKRIKHLEGLIPICMYCKKIRNTHEIWQNLEEYLAEHTDASFTHGMCPDCLDSHMNGLHALFEGKLSQVCKHS